MVGNAGEFYVLAELTRRGWTSAMTSRNNRAYDILAKKGDCSVAIRVKTKTAKSTVFRWNAKKDGMIFLDLADRNDYCVLVDIPDGEKYPIFYIVPTTEINSWLNADFKKWRDTPGARGQQRNPTNKIRLFYVDDDTSRNSHGYTNKLEQYRSAWQLLES